MLNQVVIVGRLTKDIELHNSENGSKVTTIIVAVPRSFKNINGEYETDFIECTAFDIVATNTSTYCRKGDIIGIKGRLASKTVEIENKKIKKVEVIAEKITFLSSKSSKEEEK